MVNVLFAVSICLREIRQSKQLGAVTENLV